MNKVNIVIFNQFRYAVVFMEGMDLSEGSDYNPFLITDIGILTDHQNNIRIGMFRHSLEPSQYSNFSLISYAALYMDVLALSEGSDNNPFLITDTYRSFKDLYLNVPTHS